MAPKGVLAPSGTRAKVSKVIKPKTALHSIIKDEIKGEKSQHLRIIIFIKNGYLANGVFI